MTFELTDSASAPTLQPGQHVRVSYSEAASGTMIASAIG